jgi:hypothetical protein
VIDAILKVSLDEQQQEIKAAWQRLSSVQALSVEMVPDCGSAIHCFTLGE